MAALANDGVAEAARAADHDREPIEEHRILEVLDRSPAGSSRSNRSSINDSSTASAVSRCSVIITRKPITVSATKAAPTTTTAASWLVIPCGACSIR